MGSAYTTYDPGVSDAMHVQEARIYAGNAAGVVPSGVLAYVYEAGDVVVTIDVTVPASNAFLVFDAVGIKRAANAGGANNWALQNGTTAITTTAVNLNVNDTLIARATVLNDAQWQVASGSNLRADISGAGNNAGWLVALGLPV